MDHDIRRVPVAAELRDLLRDMLSRVFFSEVVVQEHEVEAPRRQGGDGFAEIPDVHSLGIGIAPHDDLMACVHVVENEDAEHAIILSQATNACHPLVALTILRLMHARFASLLVTGLLLVASSACSPSAPPEECVRAGARLKELGTSGPRGYDSPEIPGLIALARSHREHSSEACRTANWWANDAEKTRPKPVAAQTPASIPASNRVPVPAGTFSANALHGCNLGCEASLDRCSATAGCRLGTYQRSGRDGQFGFGQSNTVPYSCSTDPVNGPAAERAMKSCIDQINACYQQCVR